ncbi:MAG: Holliday junction branch migration protein RuvA [bacterium JZ-2024 1]
MITGLRGKVIRRERGGIEIEVGPVRLGVRVPSYLSEMSREGKPIALETALLNDESGWHLYGFQTSMERDFFLRLLQINSVGRKAALKVLDDGLESALARIYHAWRNEKPTLSGLGPKTSRNVIAELGEEVAKGRWGKAHRNEESTEDDALEALIALGAKEREAREALRKAMRRIQAGAPAERVVREALKYLK